MGSSPLAARRSPLAARRSLAARAPARPKRAPHVSRAAADNFEELLASSLSPHAPRWAAKRASTWGKLYMTSLSVTYMTTRTTPRLAGGVYDARSRNRRTDYNT